jgi:asparagine synthase (glutamine-hydrolysing)
LFLAWEWVGSDRTLCHNVRVVPAGVLWKWEKSNNHPIQKQYYPLRTLSVLPRKKKFTRADAICLSDEMVKMLSELTSSFGELECPITSGRDSRVLVSVLLRGGIKAQYYTAGLPNSSDVRISKQISSSFGLSHEVTIISSRDLSDEWEDLSWELIKQNDGMVSLWQIADTVRQSSHIESLAIRLWGIGGEIGRRSYRNPSIFFQRKDVRGLRSWLAPHVLKNYDGLITKQAMEMSEKYLGDWVEQALEEGFSPVDLPDLLYTTERIRRWAGDNARKARPVVDLFSPFCTRPFVESAFAIPALRRYSEPIHYQLVLLEPELHRIRFGEEFKEERWYSQLPIVNILHVCWKKKGRELVSGAILFDRKKSKPDPMERFDQSGRIHALGFC